jgi:hypothetical protein
MRQGMSSERSGQRFPVSQSKSEVNYKLSLACALWMVGCKKVVSDPALLDAGRF